MALVLPTQLTFCRTPTASVNPVAFCRTPVASMRLGASWAVCDLGASPQHAGYVTDGTHTLCPSLHANPQYRRPRAVTEPTHSCSLAVGTWSRAQDTNAFSAAEPAAHGTKSMCMGSLLRPQRPAALSAPELGARSRCAGRVRFAEADDVQELPEGMFHENAQSGSSKTESFSGSMTWAIGDANFGRRPQCHETTAVSVVAPGGGTMFNGSVYAALGRRPNIKMEILGQSRAAYDRYPEGWPQGGPAPNLDSFANDILAQGVIEKSTCLIVGSRGGQVVLPALWRARGEDVPPAVVLNGGCAMGLPTPVQWPDNAVTFLLLGGQDYFRGSFSPKQHIADARGRVPYANSTTAILFVNEMSHMPDSQMLMGILHLMVSVVVSWKTSVRLVRSELDDIMQVLVKLGMSGHLHYTTAPESWEQFRFSPGGVSRA